MVRLAQVVYSVDSADRIAAVNRGWVEFARANHGGLLLPPGILGRHIWELVADETTQQIYRALFSRVRRGLGPIQFAFRCDAPDRRRLLRMTVRADTEGGVRCEVQPLVDQPRVEVPLLQPADPDPDPGQLLRVCGWCKRVATGEGTWLEVEDAVRALRLFEAPVLPQITHGICPDCFEAMSKLIDAPERWDESHLLRLGDLTDD